MHCRRGLSGAIVDVNNASRQPFFSRESTWCHQSLCLHYIGEIAHAYCRFRRQRSVVKIRTVSASMTIRSASQYRE
jgi:hypothetical protein